MTFEDLNLTKFLRKALVDMQITTPTTIQQKVFPVATSGRDVLGIAQTGTGKTLAFLLPVLTQWKFSKSGTPQIIILEPTRELVTQVHEIVERLTEGVNCKSAALFGGVGMMPQAEKVAEGVDVIVSTPGRLLDMALNGHVKLRDVKKLVVDEVDEMLAQGFNSQLGRIFDLLPKKRQNLLFSATMTEGIERMMDVYFNSPQKVEAARAGTPIERIEQRLYKVPNFNTKINFLNFFLVQSDEFRKVLVFVSSLDLADKVFELLSPEVVADADYIHSKRTQSQRFRALKAFANAEIRILLATDLVARGIDVEGVTHVINFDLPSDPRQHIHRIGRTGRADSDGIAITFCSPLEEEKLVEIVELQQKTIAEYQMPDSVEVSNVLTKLDVPTYKMKNSLVEVDATPGNAFHERAEHNQKVNVRISHKQKMKQKYGKPITKAGTQYKKK